jgi:RNA polymerase sigma factor (sigma-70 family)
MRTRNGVPINGAETDAAIVARVRAGDREAYAELVRRHAPTALRTASLLGAGPDAEDVVQEAFVKAYARLGTFRDGSPFRPWLLRIVTNETHNLHRGAGRRRAREQLAWARTERLLAEAEPLESALSSERREALIGTLRRLAERDRQVVVCRYLLGLDEAESAAVLGWPRGTVKSRLSRALRRLEAMLQEELHA